MRPGSLSTALAAATLLAACATSPARPTLAVTTIPRTIEVSVQPPPPPDSAEWLAITPLGLEETRLNLEVANHTAQEVEVKWGDAAITGMDGARHGLDVVNLKLDARRTVPLPSRLPPYSVVQVRMTPNRAPRFPASVEDSAEAERLCGELRERAIEITLPVQRGREKRVYTLRFGSDVHVTVTRALRPDTYICGTPGSVQ